MKPDYLAKYRRYALLRVFIIATLSVLITAVLFYVADNAFNGLLIDIIESFSVGLAYFIVQQKSLFVLLAYVLVIMVTAIITAIRYTRHLSLVVDSIDLIFEEDSTLIQLPGQLKDVENKLNMVKYDMMRSQQLAQEAEQRKNDLVVYLAHDLKTPLTSVIGYLSLLYDEPDLPAPLREKYIAISLDKSERLEDLINEFFEITRFNLQSISLERSRVNLSVMLDQMADEFYPLFSAKHLSCHLDLPEQLVLMGDGDKLARVFDNVLRNAINYSYPDTIISIMGRRQEERIHLAFHNQGDPIPAHKMDRIFEKFFRLDTARASETGGAGLGLAIAKEILELHEGSIAVTSDEEGTTFTIVLPTQWQ